MKVLKFGAVWCSGCLVMKPRWQQIEKEHPWLVTEYIEFDEENDQIKHFSIDRERLPVFVFQDKTGNEIERVSGEIDKKILVDKINQYKNK